MGIFDQNNRYSSKINRFEYKQWRFFQNWIKKNGIMNLYWIDTTLINTINVFLMFSVHSLDQFEPPYIFILTFMCLIYLHLTLVYSIARVIHAYSSLVNDILYI